MPSIFLKGCPEDLRNCELKRLIEKAAWGLALSVLALAACLLPARKSPGASPSPEPAASATAPPVNLPTPAPTPLLTGGPEPEASPPPQEDLSGYGLPDGALVNPYATYSYEQMNEDIAQLERKHPQLISSFSIGKSVEGRELTAFAFGRGKREVVLCSTMHACEHIATNVLMHMVDRYCLGYEAGESYGGLSYREILDNVKFIVIPMLNPDGVNLAQNGPDAALDPEAVRRIGGAGCSYASWKANINGVDLNGNFRHKWGIRDEVTAPAPFGWAGPYAASEPETRAMLRLLDRVDFYMFVSLHIRGEVIYWLDSDTLDRYDEYRPIAARFAKAFGFELLEPEDVSDRGGYMINSARVEYGRFCMTVELCPYISGDPFPLSLFDRSAEPVYSLGLIMGDEAMKMDELSLRPDVYLNGKLLMFYPQRPVEDNGCVLAPAFELLSKCGVRWAWWGDGEGLLEAWRGDNKVELRLGSKTMVANGAPVELDAPLRYEGGTLMLPVCRTLRALRMGVEYDAEKKNVLIEGRQRAR